MVQMTPEFIKLRIKFKKIGKLQYISHLDLVRTMNKIIVRSGLPIWYTEGFNPKPKMVFAAPLSIGTESYTEFMDVRLVSEVDLNEVKEVLNTNMTEEMQVTEVYYPNSKFTDMRWLAYTIKIKTEGANEALAARCDEILNADKIEVLKHTKSGEQTVDIRPLVKSSSAVLDGGCIRISAVLSSDPSSFLNPEYVIKALRSGAGILSDPDLTKEGYSIVREVAYFEDMREFR